MAQHNTLGSEGEKKALSYLQKHDYLILHRNWHYKHKEIDLVAQKDECLIFIEVKTRTSGGMQNAEESITTNKMRYLIEAADAYITKYNRKEEARFDLLAFTVKNEEWKLNHIKAAFNSIDI